MPRINAQTSSFRYETHGLWTERLLAKPSREILLENLNRKIDEAGMTSAEFARAVGVTPGVVSKWRKGIISPEVDRLTRIADVLNIPVAALFIDPTDDRSTGIELEVALRMVAEAVKKAQKKD